ncbi:MAG: hypothetical protein KF749_12195 [Bacteroidetes bacterium]|nr:hypothetical protein [Bacteroidota bacterium]MCW5895335.1 hypothetical protein [Bacteroidota bacterium]
MDWIRIAQGLVFLGASFLVVVVGMRGIDPEAISLDLVYSALYLESGMLALLAFLYMFTNSSEPNKAKALRTTITEIDGSLKAVVENLNANGRNSLPPGVMDQLSEIKGRVGYMKGIIN